MTIVRTLTIHAVIAFAIDIAIDFEMHYQNDALATYLIFNDED